MDKNINKLLCVLDNEIDRKCFEIKQRKRNKILQSVFIITCVLFIIVPMMFVFRNQPLDVLRPGNTFLYYLFLPSITYCI